MLEQLSQLLNLSVFFCDHIAEVAHRGVMHLF